MTGSFYLENGPLDCVSSFNPSGRLKTVMQEPGTVSQLSGNAMNSRRPTVERDGLFN
jgi:hypothetical protein